jgi:hypothetical protein
MTRRREESSTNQNTLKSRTRRENLKFAAKQAVRKARYFWDDDDRPGIDLMEVLRQNAEKQQARQHEVKRMRRAWKGALENAPKGRCIP